MNSNLNINNEIKLKYLKVYTNGMEANITLNAIIDESPK